MPIPISAIASSVPAAHLAADADAHARGVGLADHPAQEAQDRRADSQS